MRTCVERLPQAESQLLLAVKRIVTELLRHGALGVMSLPQ